MTKQKRAIPTQEFVRELFDYADGRLIWRVRRCGQRPIGSVAGSAAPGSHGYFEVGIGGRNWPLHRIVWLWHFGTLPSGDIDHINRNRLDNRIENLRLASRRENLRNMTVRSDPKSSKWKGVSWAPNANKWRAYIKSADRKRKHLGYFPDEADAAQAYNFAAVQYFGEFAALNYTDQEGLGFD